MAKSKGTAKVPRGGKIKPPPAEGNADFVRPNGTSRNSARQDSDVPRTQRP